MIHKPFTNVTTNTTSSEFSVTSNKPTVYCFGTFDTVTVTVEVSPDGSSGSWVPVAELTFTSAGGKRIDIYTASMIHVVSNGVGGSTSINLWVQED